jgi:hypothetical protein
MQSALSNVLYSSTGGVPVASLSEPQEKVARDADVSVKEPLPFFTIHIADINSILAVAKNIAGIVGVDNAQFDSTVDMMLSSINGLSRTAPIGIVMRTNGKDFNDPLILLPIKDVSTFSIPPLASNMQIEKIENNKFKVQLPAFNLIAYQKEGYAIIVPETSTAPIPEKPKAYFEKIEKNTIGVKIDFANSSHEQLVQLTAPMVMIMAMQNPEAGEQFQKSIEMMKFYFDEFKTLDYGIKVDPKTLDVDVSINLESSAKGKIFANLRKVIENRQTIFSNFKTAKTPIFAVNQAVAFDNYTVPEYMQNLGKEQWNTIIDGALKQIEEDADSEDEVKYAKAAVVSLKKLIDIYGAVGECDYAITFDEDGTLFAASIAKETNEIKTLCTAIMNFIKAKHNESEDRAKFDRLVNENLKVEYATASGYKLTRLTIPFSAIIESHKLTALSKMKDKSYTLFAAIKDNTAIAVAGGFDAGKTEETLKTALETTSSPTKLKQPMLQFDLQVLGKFLKNIGLEDIDKGEPTEGLTKSLIDLLIKADKAKIIFTDSINGATYSSSIKMDGEIVNVIAKIAKQVSERVVKLQNDDDEDEDE